MDRETESAAREVIERLCTAPEARRAWIDIAVESIEAASAVSAEAWEITLFPHLVRMNVGQISVLELFSGNVGLYTEGRLSLKRRRGVRLAPWRNYAAIAVPSQRWLISHDVLPELPKELIEAHLRLVQTAAMAKARSPFRYAHSPNVVAYLNAEHTSGRIEVVAPLSVDHGDTAAFGDPEKNKLIEAQAIAIAKQHYEIAGWRVHSVERDKVGYDLKLLKSRAELHVEVKGASNPCDKFVITAQEVRTSLSDDAFVLCLVDTIHSGSPRLREWPATQFRTAVILEPIQYWARLKPAG